MGRQTVPGCFVLLKSHKPLTLEALRDRGQLDVHETPRTVQGVEALLQTQQHPSDAEWLCAHLLHRAQLYRFRALVVGADFKVSHLTYFWPADKMSSWGFHQSHCWARNHYLRQPKGGLFAKIYYCYFKVKTKWSYGLMFHILPVMSKTFQLQSFT